MTQLERQCDTGHVNDRYITPNGATYPQWLRQAAVDVLTGDRTAMPTYTDFLKAFAADPDGYVTIHAIKDPATGEDIPINPPLRVHVDDLHKLDPTAARSAP
jgi:hypothetical protein